MTRWGEQEPSMVEVPETDRDPAPVVGVDIPVQYPGMADGSPFPEPVTDMREELGGPADER